MRGWAKSEGGFHATDSGTDTDHHLHLFVPRSQELRSPSQGNAVGAPDMSPLGAGGINWASRGAPHCLCPVGASRYPEEAVAKHRGQRGEQWGPLRPKGQGRGLGKPQVCSPL